MQYPPLTHRIARPAFLALAAAAALAAAPIAHATDNVYWSLGVQAAPGVSVGVSNARPVYVQPAPVYMHPAPVIVQAPPRYVMPPPVYVQPNVYYSPPSVYYGPPQVVYGGPRYVGPPAYATGWVPPGHRHGHRHWHRDRDRH